MSRLLLSVLSCVIFFSDALNYSNRWTVQIDGDNEEANRLARKHGFVNQGKIIDDYYSFEHQMVERISNLRTTHLHKGLISEPNVKMVEQQELKSYDLLSSQSRVEFSANDPRLKDMWYIKRYDGQPTYNVIDVWERNITGAGVVVAVVDEGIDPEHPELKANYDATASFDVVDNDNYPLPSDPSVSINGHGNKCAGIIAAVLNNSNCGVGLAYKAHIGGIRLINQAMASDADEARAFSHASDHIDIYSNSWGPLGWGNIVRGPGRLSKLALRRGTEKGRRGKGSIYVFSAGNGGMYGDSCAFDGYVNSIFTIAITGLKSDGSLPTFSEPCSGLMAVTYSRDSMGDSSEVITADINKGCANDFDASSASAAMASGLIALMLSARPSLSWRDVQHIIVRTARPGPVKGTEWNTNNAGLKVSDRVGFGLMDAKKMVDVALNWTTVPPKVNCTVPLYGVNSRIPSNGVLEETISLTKWNDLCGSKINYLEHVEVAVNLNYTRRGDLLIKLISPRGTSSKLTHYRMTDSGATDLHWVLMSLHYWGENAIGPWKLTLQNSQLSNNTGILFDWALILHGTEENPLGNNSHISTTVSPQTTEKRHSSLPSKRTSSSTEALPLTEGKSTLQGLPSKRTPSLTEALPLTEGKSTSRGITSKSTSSSTKSFTSESFTREGKSASRGLPSKRPSSLTEALPLTEEKSTLRGITSKSTSSSTESFTSENFSREEKSALRDPAAWKLGVGLGLSIPAVFLSVSFVAWLCLRRKKKRNCRSHPGPLHLKEEERKGEGNSYEVFNVTVIKTNDRP